MDMKKGTEMKTGVIALCLTLTGCATPAVLTPQAAKVQLLFSGNQAAQCQNIKMISETSVFGAEDAKNAALNDAALAGANAFYVITVAGSLVDAGENGTVAATSVGGMALNCRPDTQK